MYFMAPTLENIQRLCQDLAARLYAQYYINFSSVVSRDLLEELAHKTLQDNTYGLISQVYDQYLNYSCPEPYMFSLGLHNSYFRLNNPAANDTDIETFIKSITTSLFSVFITTGVLPVIRAARGNAAEMVARALDARLRDHYRNSRNRDPSLEQQQRPVLIIVDRNMDLGTMLHHTWSYQCLAHDVFEMKSSRIAIPSPDDSTHTKMTVYDLDLNDFFWAKNAAAPFPMMAEDVDAELQKYKQESDELTRSFGVDNLSEIDVSDPTTNAKFIKTAIAALPKLTQRKRIIDMHMKIASALLKKIQERSLDAFIMAEEQMSKQSKASILEVIRDPKKGSSEDKLRLFMVYYLSLESEMSKADMKEFEDALIEAGCQIAALKYVKSSRALMHMASALTGPAQTHSRTSDFMSRFSTNLGAMRESAFGSAVEGLISGVKNILPASQNLPITRIVEGLLDSGSSTLSLGTSSTPDDDFLYFDPKSAKPTADKRTAPKIPKFQDAFVFVVGGGNYVEYQNLLEFAKNRKMGERVTYGATEILNASAFLNQLAQLGSQPKQ